MGYRNLLVCLLATSLMISGSAAYGSGFGALTGPASGIGSHDTGLRESVSLQPVGNLLIGRPAGSTIELIVVDAPTHSSRADHLILRELETQNGARSLLLSASSDLRKHLRRVTLYIRGSNPDMVLLEQLDGTRKRHLPQIIQSARNTEMLGNQQLLAFTLERLGLYWISSANPPAMDNDTKLPMEPTASALLGGGISRGLLPWGLSGLLLIIIMSLSNWVHVTEKWRGK